MFDKFKALMYKWNEHGIPIPTFRDGRNKGSYTLTMFVISFLVAIITLFGKVTYVFGDVDYLEVLGLLGLTGGFYLGRKYQNSKDKSFTLDVKEEKKENNE